MLLTFAAASRAGLSRYETSPLFPPDVSRYTKYLPLWARWAPVLALGVVVPRVQRFLPDAVQPQRLEVVVSKLQPGFTHAIIAEFGTNAGMVPGKHIGSFVHVAAVSTPPHIGHVDGPEMA